MSTVSTPKPIRPLTAFTHSYSCSPGPIESIYKTESQIFNLSRLQINPQTPSTAKNSATNKRRYHFRSGSMESNVVENPDLSSYLKKDLIKRSQVKKRRKFPINDIFQLREIRCKALNNLITACRTIKPSGNFKKIIDKEQKFVSTWSKKMDQVTENLMKLTDNKQEFIEGLYYFNKLSNEDILSDVMKLKKKKEQNIVIIKRKQKRRSNSEFG